MRLQEVLLRQARSLSAIETGNKAASCSRRSFIRQVLLGGIGGAVSVGYAYQIEPGWIKVEKVTVGLDNLPHAFDGVRIVQLSDFHADPSTDLSSMIDIARIVNALAPDLVVATGDYVTGDKRYMHLVSAALGRVKGRFGCMAVLGNHDYLAGENEVAEALVSSEVTLLRNQNRPLECDGSRIWVVGVDDVWEEKHDLDASLLGIPEHEVAILLVHEPDYVERVAADGRPILQLSGHSHGGQVRLPVVGALHLPPLGRKYPWGLREVGGTYVYTSRGLGTISYRKLPAIRMNCRPEITLLTLTRKCPSG